MTFDILGLLFQKRNGKLCKTTFYVVCIINRKKSELFFQLFFFEFSLNQPKKGIYTNKISKKKIEKKIKFLPFFVNFCNFK